MAKKAARGEPAAKDDPEGRIRAVLGVSSDRPVPGVLLEALRTYHAHLTANLSFPFEGRLSDPIGPHRDRGRRCVSSACWTWTAIARRRCTA